MMPVVGGNVLGALLRFFQLSVTTCLRNLALLSLPDQRHELVW